MDIARLEALEKQITHLIQAFIRIKEENTHLMQRLAQLQQMLHDQQHSLERWQSDQEELASLRTHADLTAGAGTDSQQAGRAAGHR